MHSKKTIKGNADPLLAEWMGVRDASYKIRTRGLTEEQKDRLHNIRARIWKLHDKIDKERAAKALSAMESLEKRVRRLEKK